MGGLKREDKVDYALAKLKASWKIQKKTSSKNALFKAVIYAYKCRKISS
jgi:hypothetical protein